ncbi:MAG: OmpP1/FadL family transporter [Akkermansiaceae bacterium]
MNNTQTKYTAIAAILSLSSVPLMGAGFQLAERSARGMGRAFSGEAAIADDASVIASNPAGMILLDDNAISAGLQFIDPNVNIKGAHPHPMGGAVSDKDVASSALIPYFFFSKKINDHLSVGLGTYSSFGLATDYSSGAASIIGTDKSEITTVTINPSLAYRVNEALSVGVGLDIMYAEGRLTAANTAFDPIPGPVGSSLFDLQGDDWSIGWNIGLLYQLNESTRIGLHYRSTFDLKIEGDASGALVGGVKRDATLEVELPDTLELSVYHEVNDKWAVHGDVLWTNWSTFKQLAPKVGIPAADAALVVDENWEDAFRYSIGVTYKHSDRLTLRGGLAYDESPVRTQDRTLRIPDGDRIWASIGATIKLNDCYNLDLAYTHIFAGDSDVNLNEPQFNGKAGGDVDMIAVGISGSF